MVKLVNATKCVVYATVSKTSFRHIKQTQPIWATVDA